MDDTESKATFGNRTFTQTPLPFGFGDEIRADITAARMQHWADVVLPAITHHVLPRIAEDLHGTVIAAAVENMARTSLRPEEWRNYFNSTRGNAMLLWGMIRKHHKDEFPTVDAVHEFINSLPLSEVAAEIDRVAGVYRAAGVPASTVD